VTTCILIHGTFARNADWTQEGSAFREALSSHFPKGSTPLCFETLLWSGWNTRRSRFTASEALHKLITRLKKDRPDEEVILIGHSHGGSIIAYCAKIYPEIMKNVSGFVFLSTPFIAIRIRDDMVDILHSILFFGLVLAAGVLTSVLILAFVNSDLGLVVSLSMLIIFFCWIPALTNSIANRLHRRLEQRLARHVQQSQTADFSSTRTMIVHMVGDEVAVVFSFARAIGMLAGRLAKITQMIGRWLRAVTTGRTVHGGSYFISAVMVIWAVLAAKLEIPDVRTWWYLTNATFVFLLVGCSCIGILYFIVLLMLMAAQSIALMVFGWLSLLDAIFCEFSVAVAPFGARNLVSVDWNMSRGVEQKRMSHSRTYTNLEALRVISAWVANPLSATSEAVTTEQPIAAGQKVDVVATPNVESNPIAPLGKFTREIDWKHCGAGMRVGDLGGLPNEQLRAAIRSAAQLPDIVAYAKNKEIDPVVAVVGMMAWSARAWSREAELLSTTMIRDRASDNVKALMMQLGLRCES